MQQPDFSVELEKICGGIKSRSKREEVEEELLGHLEDIYSRNIAMGLNEEEAKSKAVESLGNEDTLRYQFASVHTYSPLDAMSSAFSLLTFGFILMFIHIELFEGFGAILSAIGSFLVLLSCLRLRTAGKKLNIAFAFNISLAMLTAAFKGLSYYLFLPIGIHIAYYIIFGILSSLFWCFMFSGINELCKKYAAENTKIPSYNFCAAFMVLFYLINSVIMVSMAEDGGNINVNSTIIAIVVFAVFIWIAKCIYRGRKILWNADGEYGISHSTRFTKSVAAVVVAISIAFPLSGMLAYSFKESEKSSYVMHNCESDELTKEAEKIRKKLISLDMPEEILADIPDSEILNYRYAEKMLWCASGNSNERGVQSDTELYCFILSKTDFNGEVTDHPCVRALYRIRNYYSPEKTHHYRAGSYFSTFYRLPLVPDDDDIFIEILSEENGNTVCEAPLRVLNLDSDNILNSPRGFEYKEGRDKRIYFAQDFSYETNISYGDEDRDRLHFDMSVAAVRQKFPILFNAKDVSSFVKTIFNDNHYNGGTDNPFFGYAVSRMQIHEELSE